MNPLASDHDLLHAWLEQHDAAAFTALVERHLGMVLATCRRVGGSAVAEDAAQEVFLELVRHARQIRSHLPAWLHAVAVRTAVRWRKLRPEGCALPDLPGPPMDRDEVEDLRREIDAAVERLPADLRAPLVLVILEGCSQADAAMRLGLSQSTVSRRIEDALARLRADLGPVWSAPAVAALVPAAAPTELASACATWGLAPPAAATGTATAAAGMPLVAWLMAAVVTVAGIGLSVIAASADPPMPPAPVVTVALTGAPPDLKEWAHALTVAGLRAGIQVQVAPGLLGAPAPIGATAATTLEAQFAAARTDGYRVARHGDTVVVDRPAPPALATAWAEARDRAALADAARGILLGGDLSQLRPLLLDLTATGPRWDAAWEAVAHLAIPGARPVPANERGSPLAVFIGDPAVAAVVTTALTEVRHPGDAIIAAGLAAMMGVQTARPRLAELAAGPEAGPAVAALVASVHLGDTAVMDAAVAREDGNGLLVLLIMADAAAELRPGLTQVAMRRIRDPATPLDLRVDLGRRLADLRIPIPDDLADRRARETDGDLVDVLDRWSDTTGRDWPGDPGAWRRVLDDPTSPIAHVRGAGRSLARRGDPADADRLAGVLTYDGFVSMAVADAATGALRRELAARMPALVTRVAAVCARPPGDNQWTEMSGIAAILAAATRLDPAGTMTILRGATVLDPVNRDQPVIEAWSRLAETLPDTAPAAFATFLTGMSPEDRDSARLSIHMRLPPAARPADVTFWIHRSPLKDLRTAGAIRNLCLQQSPDYPAHIAWSVPERSPVVMAGDLRTVLNAVQSTSTSAAGVPDAIMTTFQVGGEPLGRHIIRLGHPDRGPWATLSDANTWHWPGWGIGGYLGVPIPSALHQEVLDLLTARVLATRGAEQRYAAAILLSHARTGVDLGAERRLLEERFPGLVATAEAMARRFNAPLSPSRMTSGDRILLRQGLDRLPGRSTPTAVAEPGTWTVRWMESDYRMHVVIRIQTEADPAQPLRRKATVELHEPKRSLATYPAWAFRDANGVIHVDARGQKVSGRANWRPESYAIHADGAVGYLDNSGSGGWGLRVEALPATTPPEPTPAPAAPPRTEGF